MNCRTAVGMITRYINHTLSVSELEEFLEHIYICPSCYDELETYFIVYKAIQQLDEDEEENVLDFKELLEEDIRMNRRCIRTKKFGHAAAGMGFCFLIAGLGGFLLYIMMQLI